MALARHRMVVVASIVMLGLARRAPLVAQDGHDSTRYVLNDSHFHLTNYVQEGPTLPQFLT